jgi:Flp pilus assembly protein TadG
MIKTRHSRGSPKEQGAITPILAACLAMGLGLLALTVDLGQLFVAKNELQNIADAAALAGAQNLIQESTDAATPGLAEVHCSDAISAVQAVAADNKSFGAAMTVAPADVLLGKWDTVSKTFNPTGCSASTSDVNAVQVTVRRDGTDNPSLASFFGGILGTPTMNSQATAVAFLGWAGTTGTGSLGLPFAVSSNPSGAFPGLSRHPVRQSPYARSNPLDWFMPQPAIASGPTEYTWKDLGGASLDTTKGTFIMPKDSERTDLSKLQKYIKGPNGGGLAYPSVKVGQKVYPISEYRWTTNVYNNFDYLRNRFNVEKGANGKWRVTAAVYYTNNPTAAAPPAPKTWLGLAQGLLGPKPAYACASYTSPVSYLQGFITLDIKEVICDKNDDGVWDSTCKSYAYPDSRSCDKKCKIVLDVPVDQNFKTTGTPENGQGYKDMNSTAPLAGIFASVPYLVK